MTVNSENIEMMIMMMVDNELSSSEVAEVTQYISDHPQYQEFYNDMLKINEHIPNDDQIVYEDKAALLSFNLNSNEQKALVNKKFVIFKYAIAASVIFGLFGLSYMLSFKDNTNFIANDTSNKTILASVENDLKDKTVEEEMIDKAIITAKSNTRSSVKRRVDLKSEAIHSVNKNSLLIDEESVRMNTKNLQRIIVHHNTDKAVAQYQKPELSIITEENHNTILGANVRLAVVELPLLLKDEVLASVSKTANNLNNTIKEIKNCNIELSFGNKTLKLK